MTRGIQSIQFEKPPLIISTACVAGKKEGEGPLGASIDVVEQDGMFGMNTWEEAESAMQKQAAELALEKAGLEKQDIRYLFAGDLLGQLIATSFGTGSLQIPTFGLYGACSTMGEALILGAMTVHAGYADRVISMASSHYATAEKQFRFPLAYGNQRPFSASWTVTGCGAAIVARDDGGEEKAGRSDKGGTGGKAGRSDREGSCGPGNGRNVQARIVGVTPGRIVDLGIKDSMNMGAAMAPAAVHTIKQNFEDFGVDQTYYDKIITGDLGEVGRQIVLDMMKHEGYDLESVYMDCGMEIFDKETQDTHAGGSGCGCAAVTLCAKILPMLKSGQWKRVLFIPTGALHSTVSFNEGQNIPGIAHGVMLEA